MSGASVMPRKISAIAASDSAPLVCRLRRSPRASASTTRCSTPKCCSTAKIELMNTMIGSTRIANT